MMKRRYILCYPLFPFDKIPVYSPVVIYGMGMVGTHYVQQLLACQTIQLKYTVDADWRTKNYKNIKCMSPDSLKNEREAVIVVAISSEKRCKKILNLLQHFGIEKERIICGVKFCTIATENQPTLATYEYSTRNDMDKVLFRNLTIIKELLYIKKVAGKSLIRVGNANDGGYVMVDNFDFDDAEKIAYSFGINDDVSWDTGIAAHGYNVYMYDHTISDVPCADEKLHFFCKGIAGCEETDKLLYLDTILRKNFHNGKRNMILKMDVEGAEWEFIEKTTQSIFTHFDQMLFEFHGITNSNLQESIIENLKKLNETHQVVHVHGNNYGNVIWIDDMPFPDSIEVTYARKGTYDFLSDGDISLPIPQDSPCNPQIEDVRLGKWNSFYGK